MRFPVIGLLLLLSGNCFCQNLLVNGDFEEENICTEYKINCAPEAWISNTHGFNNYFKDAKRANAGEHFMAIEAGHSFKPFQRTFIRSRLLCGLRKGNQYRLEFFVKSPHDILDSIGVIFTSFDFLFEQKKLQGINPSFFIKPVAPAFAKDSSWQKVSMIYTASGEESFISIGNFSRRDINGSTNLFMENLFFVFLDGISLTPVNPNESICPEWESNKQDIYDQDERHEFLQRLIRTYRRDPPTVVIPSTKVVRIDTLVLPDVLFATGKAALQPLSYRVIDSFCSRLTGKQVDSIVVEGHTDNTGTIQINEKLSVDRAVTVEEAIRKRMGQRVLIIVRGWADSRPVADNSKPAGRERNRRVELLVYIRE